MSVVTNGSPREREPAFWNALSCRQIRTSFIGRVYDLSIVSLHFDSYDEVAQYPDCKYVIDTKYWLTGLARRVESLNMVGDMLWLDPVPKNFRGLVLTRYEWLTVTTDVFLTRYISVIDCALILVNDVYCLGLPPKKCTLQNLKKKALPDTVADHLKLMLGEQEVLRNERNSRIHHGEEREFTDDDQTFKIASLFNDKFHGMKGTDRYGRRINVDRSFKGGLVSIQRDFNRSTRLLKKQVDNLYDQLGEEFEEHFDLLVAAATRRPASKANAKISVPNKIRLFLGPFPQDKRMTGSGRMMRQAQRPIGACN